MEALKNLHLDKSLNCFLSVKMKHSTVYLFLLFTCSVKNFKLNIQCPTFNPYRLQWNILDVRDATIRLRDHGVQDGGNTVQYNGAPTPV